MLPLSLEVVVNINRSIGTRRLDSGIKGCYHAGSVHYRGHRLGFALNAIQEMAALFTPLLNLLRALNLRLLILELFLKVAHNLRPACFGIVTVETPTPESSLGAIEDQSTPCGRAASIAGTGDQFANRPVGKGQGDQVTIVNG